MIRKAIIDGQPRTHRPWKKILIVVEGIYSMEGEMCPLKEIVAIKKKYRAYLFVDEAHSIGAIGSSGRGITEHAKVNPADVDILMGTFTKSFGAVGGYIASTKEIVSALREHSAGSLYSASISPPAAMQVIAAMQLILGEDGTDLGMSCHVSCYCTLLSACPDRSVLLHPHLSFIRSVCLSCGLWCGV